MDDERLKGPPQDDEMPDYASQDLHVLGSHPPASALPDLDFPPDPALVAQGWERRFMADPVRAREAKRLYSELGFEVHCAQIKPAELSEVCGDCALETCLAYVTIYTRKKTGRDPDHGTQPDPKV